jgi:hypothetical protein
MRRILLLSVLSVFSGLVAPAPLAAAPLVVRRLLKPGARTPPTSTTFSYFQPSQYQEVRSAATKLLDQYPPDRHVYVGVGRALSPVIALLQNLDHDIAFNFPASGINASTGYDPTPYKEEFFRHFEKLIPASVLKGNKDIVLIDRSVRNSGSSIYRVQQLLKEYLVRIGSNVKVLGAGFSEQQPGHSLGWVNTSSLPFMMQIHNARATHGNDGEFYENAFGEYPKHYIGRTHRLEQLVRKSSYDELKSFLRQHMEQDDQLDAYLHNSQHITRKDD